MLDKRWMPSSMQCTIMDETKENTVQVVNNNNKNNILSFWQFSSLVNLRVFLVCWLHLYEEVKLQILLKTVQSCLVSYWINMQKLPPVHRLYPRQVKTGDFRLLRVYSVGLEEPFPPRITTLNVKCTRSSNCKTVFLELVGVSPLIKFWGLDL